MDVQSMEYPVGKVRNHIVTQFLLILTADLV